MPLNPRSTYETLATETVTVSILVVNSFQSRIMLQGLILLERKCNEKQEMNQCHFPTFQVCHRKHSNVTQYIISSIMLYTADFKSARVRHNKTGTTVSTTAPKANRGTLKPSLILKRKSRLDEMLMSPIKAALPDPTIYITEIIPKILRFFFKWISSRLVVVFSPKKMRLMVAPGELTDLGVLGLLGDTLGLKRAWSS